MNLMQLRYFLRTAELLNYSRAAEELLIARQSLRQSLAALEEEIGRPLFTNTRNHLGLTEYGAYLALAGRGVIERWDEMEAGLQRLMNSASALRVGFSVPLEPFIRPNTDVLLRAFRARFPDVQLTVQRMLNDEVIEAVTAGELDAGFVLQMACVRPGCRMDVFREFEVALDHSDPAAFGGRRRVGPEALREQSCLGMGSLAVTMPPLWEDCRRAGLDFPYRVVSDTLDAFYQMKHSNVIGFDILKTDVPEFSWDHTTVLEGYRWQVGLLSAESGPDPNLVQLFFRFLKQEYESVWARYERQYSAAGTGFDPAE